MSQYDEDTERAISDGYAVPEGLKAFMNQQVAKGRAVNDMIALSLQGLDLLTDMIEAAIHDGSIATAMQAQIAFNRQVTALFQELTQ